MKKKALLMIHHMIQAAKLNNELLPLFEKDEDAVKEQVEESNEMIKELEEWRDALEKEDDEEKIKILMNE